MKARKFKVVVENGCKFVFDEKSGKKGVRFYDQNGNLLTATLEVVNMVEPKIGDILKFTYADLEATWEYKTTTKIVSIETIEA